MKIATLKLAIFVSLLLCLGISIVLLFILYRPNLFLGETIEAPNQFTPILVKVVGIFAIHISVALASYFSTNYTIRVEKATERHYIAASVIILWLICFVIYILLNGFSLGNGESTIEGFNKDIDTISASISFLISGALVFLFVDNSK